MNVADNKESREDYLEDIQKYIPKLQSDLRKIKKAAPVIIKKIKKEKKNRYIALISILFSAIGLCSFFVK